MRFIDYRSRHCSSVSTSLKRRDVKADDLVTTRKAATCSVAAGADHDFQKVMEQLSISDGECKLIVRKGVVQRGLQQGRAKNAARCRFQQPVAIRRESRTAF